MKRSFTTKSDIHLKFCICISSPKRKRFEINKSDITVESVVKFPQSFRTARRKPSSIIPTLTQRVQTIFSSVIIFLRNRFARNIHPRHFIPGRPSVNLRKSAGKQRDRNDFCVLHASSELHSYYTNRYTHVIVSIRRIDIGAWGWIRCSIVG